MGLTNTSFAIKSSKILFCLLVLIYGGAAGCVLLLPWRFLWQTLVLLFCALAFGCQYWRHISLYKKHDYIGLTCALEGKWYLYDCHKNKVAVLLQKSSVIWPYCVILHFRKEIDQRFYSLLIFCDAMSPQEFHKLKVCVRTAK